MNIFFPDTVTGGVQSYLKYYRERKGFITNGRKGFFPISNEFEKSTRHRKTLTEGKACGISWSCELETSMKLKDALSEQRNAI